MHWNFLLKNERSFCTAKASHIFSTKNIGVFWDINIWNFNVSLTNDVVSLEQLGPGVGEGGIGLRIGISKILNF